MTEVTINQTHDAVGTYAVGALQPDALEAFEDHLATCASCRAETAGFREAAAELALLAAAPPPPEALRSSLLAAIGDVRQLPRTRSSSTSATARAAEGSEVADLAVRRANRRTRVLSLLVAAVSVVALGLGGAVWTSSHPQQTPAAASADASLLAAPDARIVPTTLLDGTPLSVVVSRSQNRALVVADRLPDPGVGKTYQVWLTRGGIPVPDTTVGAGEGVAQWLHGPVSDARALAVTIEPAGGSRTPTSPVLASVTF